MSGVRPYRDRAEAGRRLADALIAEVALVDPVVLGLPRGGVPVAAEVARRLGAPLDVLVARKVGAPGHEELGIGAVAEGGVRLADPSAVRTLGVSEADFDRRADAEVAELDRRVAAYRGDRALPRLTGRHVVLVDDGLATGVTASAAIAALERFGADRIVLAVPVGAPDAAAGFEALVERVVCPIRPAEFRAVGRWYDRFDQTSDAEVLAALTPDDPDGTA